MESSYTTVPRPLGNFALLARPLIRITHVLKRIRNSSEAFLVRGHDNKLYVLKPGNRPQRPNVLFNEVFGTYLLLRLGFYVPSFCIAKIARDVVLGSPDLAVILNAEADLHNTTPPLHFASEFLHEAGFRLSDTISEGVLSLVTNSSQVLGIGVFDLLVGKPDIRNCVYKENTRTGLIDTYFINNSHLFGGPAWADFTSAPDGLRKSLMALPEQQESQLEHWIAYFSKHTPQILRELFELPLPRPEGDKRLLLELLLSRLDQLQFIVRQEIAFQQTLEMQDNKGGSNSLLRSNTMGRLRYN